MSTRAFGSDHTNRNTYFPRLLGTRGAIACEHYLAAQSGRDVLTGGGNAIDAAVSATLIEGVVNPQMHTLGGECPILIGSAHRDRVSCINGNTVAPARATVDAYRDRGHRSVPDEEILAAGVPSALSALLTALSTDGRLSFTEVAQGAIDLARNGAPVHRGLLHQPNYGLIALEEKFRSRWPGSARLYLPGGTLPGEGDVLRNPRLADLLETLTHVEQSAPGDRQAGIRAVHEYFYRGDPATDIDSFSRSRGGLLARDDLERFECRLEAPVSLDYHGATIYKCGPWNQGPALLQTLAILGHFDLEHLEHNGPDYVHLLTESLKLAYADREQYYGDPRHVDVPIDALLSPAYGATRAALIDPRRADPRMRPGDPRTGSGLLPESEWVGGASWGAGTVHVDVIDADGNFAAFTPSGGWLRSAEVVPALGFPLGNRLMTFYLEPAHHPNLVAPFKQPRTTISPSIAAWGARRWMAFGSMGGDQQDQWQLQFLLNRVHFGMTVQAAIEAPKFSSEHFPGFFAPHDRFPNRLRIEPRVEPSTLARLADLGHDIEVAADWTEGYLLAAARDPVSGVLEAGCDPRGGKGEVFPAFALCW